MGKKSFGKYLGKTIRRGVNNAITPGNESQQSPEDVLAAIISGNFEKIVDNIHINEKHKEIISTINNISANTNKTNDVLSSISNNVRAITGALFGYKGITENTTDKSLLSKLGNVDTKKTIYAGLCNEIKNIGLMIQQTNHGDNKNQVESITTEISSYLRNILEQIVTISESGISMNNAILSDISNKLNPSYTNNQSSVDISGKINISGLNAKDIEVLSLISSVNIADSQANFDTIVDFLSKLNKLSFDNENIDQIGVILSNISSIFDSTAKLSNIDNVNKTLETFQKTNFLENIRSIITQIGSLEKLAEGKKSGTTAISDLLEAITNIGGFDETKFKELSNNIRKLIRMTGEPTILTGIGFSNTGLFSILFKNVSDICATCEGESDKVKAIELALKAISRIGQDFDGKDTKNLVKNISNLNEILDKSKQYNLQNCILEIINISNAAKAIESSKGVRTISSVVEGILSVVTNISTKEILEYQFKAIQLGIIVHSLDLLFKSFASFKNIKQSKDNINEVNNVLLSICNIDSEKVKAIDSLGNALRRGATMFLMTSILWSIGSHGVDSAKEEIYSLKELIAIINSDEFPTLSEDTINKIVALQNIAKLLQSISIGFATTGALALVAIPGVWASATIFKGIQSIVSNINEINIEKDFEDKTKSILKLIACSSLIMLTGAAVGKFAIDNFYSIIGFGASLGLFLFTTIGAINSASKNISANIEDAEELGKFIGICGGIMLIGGIVMTAFPQLILQSLAFSSELSLFLLTTIGAINIATRNIETAKENMQQFADLIIFSSGVLLVGAMINVMPGIKGGAFAFVTELSLFIGGTLGIYSYIANQIDDSLENAEKFGKLIGISAASLLVGGMLFAIHPWMIGTTLLFGVELATFVVGTTFIFNQLGNSLDSAVENAEKFGVLIALSSAALCLGGFLFQKYPWIILTTIAFGLELAAFVFGIVGIFNLFKNQISIALDGAKDLGILISLSAASLLIGGAFMLIPGMPLAVLEFAAIFGIFTVAVVGTYSLISKQIDKSYKTALALGALVFVTGATIIAGGYIFLKNPGLMAATLGFVGISLGMVVGMSTVIWALGKINKSALIQGEIALAGIVTITWGLGKAMQTIGAAYKMAGSDLWRFSGFLALSGATITAVGGMVLGIAALTTSTGGLGAGVLLVAEGLLAGIVGIVWEVGKAMQSIGNAMNSFANVKKIKGDTIVSNIGEFLKIGASLTPLANPLVAMAALAASATVSQISSAVSSISKSVQDFANLTVNEYDENGHKTGNKIKLGPNDFENAATNISTIITTIATAIIEKYKESPEIFSAGTIGDILGMDTPFARVVKSCTALGVMISKIAEGVKDYSTLMIPIYTGSKKTGYHQLGTSDFVNAANNIKKVISVVGGAILSLYNGKITDANGNVVGDAKEMFEWTLIGDNPFNRVLKSCSLMGNMISDIAKGIKSYAKLMMPIYDNNGKVTGYKAMQDSDFESAANNIAKVLRVVGSAIVTTYKDNEQMFTDPSSWHTSADKTPFGMVTKAMAGTGKLISEAAKAIDDTSKLRLPNTGNITKKISDIMSCVANAIMIVYDNHEEWFTDDSWFHTSASKTPFGMVRACLEGTNKIVQEAVNSIKQIQGLKLGNDLAVGGELYKQIQQVISVIPAAIMSVALDSEGKIKDEYEDSEITAAIETAFDNYLDIVKSCSKAYLSVSKLKLTTKEGEEFSISDISKIVGKMIYNLPFYIYTEYSKHPDFYGEDGEAITKSIVESFKNYEDAIDAVSDAYKTIYKSLKKLDALDDISKINILNEGLKSMLSGSAEIFALSRLNLKDISSLDSFVNTMSVYRSGISDLIDVFNKAPEDTVKYSNLQNAIDGVNEKISEVKVSKQFTKQTKDLSAFVKSINSISVARIGKFTSLIDSLNSLGAKFDGLDKFTTVLATKMATTLKYLGDQIKGSSEIINKADKIQEKRKKHIDSLIKEINRTLNTGLDITIYEGTTEPNAQGYTPTGNTPSPYITPYNGHDKTSFAGNTPVSTPNKTTTVTKSDSSKFTGVDIDYARLRTTIMAAIQAAGGATGRK